MTHKFADSLALGEHWESVLDKVFISRGYVIRPASAAEQRRGIDRHCLNRKKLIQTTLEYKADARASETGNAFVETVSVDTDNKPGWAYTSEAEYLVYFLPQDNLIYIIEMAELRKRLKRWKWEYREVAVRNVDYRTYGLLVPLREFERLSEAILSGQGNSSQGDANESNLSRV